MEVKHFRNSLKSVYLLVHQLEIAVSGCLGEDRQAQAKWWLCNTLPTGGSTDSIDMYTV